MKICLLAFSGGADSTAAAVLLKEQGYTVHLAYVRWDIGVYGKLQHEAARVSAAWLGLPLIELARVIPNGLHQATTSLADVAYAMTFWHACYPKQGYDAVSFGLHEATTDDYTFVEGETEKVSGDVVFEDTSQHVISEMAKKLRFAGKILYPLAGMTRREVWDIIPVYVRAMIWACNEPTLSEQPCGKCYKCVTDKNIAGTRR